MGVAYKASGSGLGGTGVASGGGVGNSKLTTLWLILLGTTNRRSFGCCYSPKLQPRQTQMPTVDEALKKPPT